jgi:hypothetical protein
MLRRFVRIEPGFIARRCAPALLLLSGLLVLVPPSRAQILNLGPVTVGAGLRTSYEATTPDGGNTDNQFEINDMRLYVNGPITSYLKFMFNTDYSSVTNSVDVLDAVAEFGKTPQLNLWVGRFLPPSDRANLYGPFYAHEWNVYTDGVQDGYPFVFQGRDNGAMYYGTFAKKVKISAGGFDGKSATGNPKLLGAARVQIDFWDPEDGYYLNGTYYGDKNLLAIGGATQVQDYKTATTVDFLMERKVLNGGAFTIESEYSRYNRLGGYNGDYGKSEGGYGLVSFLLPKEIGVGKPQILGKFAIAEFTDGIGVPITNPSYRQETTEVDFGYIMKQFDARVYAFGKDATFNQVMKNYWDAGVGLQFQLSKQIMGAK